MTETTAFDPVSQISYLTLGILSGHKNMIPQLSIVVPTFNERENIRPLLALLQKTLDGTNWEVVFVDDDSPDGTAEEVRAVARETENVRVIHRIGRRGLSGACIEGILSSIAPLIAVMDCDLQHDEAALVPMLNAFQMNDDLDLAVGSRNIEGGSSGEGLTGIRKWGSDVATSMTSKMLKISASDPMSGFFMVRRSSFNAIVTDLQTEGFKILADMLSASGGKWAVAEIPYTFRARQHGESKMGSAIALEFFGLLLARMSGGLVSIRLVLFMLVGFSGVIVQIVVLRLLLMGATDSFVIAQSFGVLVAMTSNFIFNNALTYKDRALKGYDFAQGLLTFYVVCSIGAIANVGVASAFYDSIPQVEMASFVGASIGATWNFIASSKFTWQVR